MIKHFFRLYIPAALVLAGICYSFFAVTNAEMMRNTQQKDQALVRLEHQLLDEEFRQFSSDLMTFSHMREWTAGLDPHGKNFADLAAEFKALLSAKNDYAKVVVLGLDGQELLRVDYHDGEPITVAESALQNKSGRYYYAPAMQLQRHQIYISPMDMRREYGVIKQLPEPIVRLITPVFDAQGVKAALLVFEVQAEQLMQRFLDLQENVSLRSMLLGQQGQWLHDGNSRNAWHFLAAGAGPEQFKQAFPEAWDQISCMESGQISTSRGLFTFLSFRPVQAASISMQRDLISQSQEHLPEWILVEYRSSAELAAISAPLANRIAAYTVLFLLLVALLIWRLVSNAASKNRVVQQLRQSEVKFRSLIEDLPSGVTILQNGKIAYVNRAAVVLFGGKSEQDFVGRVVTDFVHSESITEVTQRMQAVLQGEELGDLEEHLLALDGSDLFVLITPMKVEFDGEPAIQSVMRDITEQRTVEGAYRLSLQRHQLYMEQTTVAVIEWNTDMTVAEWNHGAEMIFGYSAAQAIGKHATGLILSADQREAIDTVWQQLLAHKGGQHSINENITRDGRTVTCEWHNTPLVGKDGVVIAVTSICSDISEKHRQQNELRKLSQAIEQAGESVLITDTEAVIEYVNPAFTQITGYAADEVIGQTPAILNSGRQHKKFYRELWQKITAGEVWHGSLVDKRKDGSLYPALMSVAPIVNEAGETTHYVSIQQDMSEHKELEERFRQAQKMEALGTLVGGIAHDFNNVLAGMLGNLYLVRMQTRDDASVQDKLDRIDKAGHRAADMIKQLLAFSRKGGGELVMMPVQPFIKEILKLARASIPENIALQHELGERDYCIRGDGSQMQQMLLNLLANASHALEQQSNPQIKISLGLFEPGDDFLFVHRDLDAVPMLCITVADNGCGISKANVERVFEPFFTTKPEGKGTGLGLAMVYGSMRNHGGAIDIESEEGQGTRVHLYFPLCDHKMPDADPRPEAVLHGSGETILIADDNEQVRETMQEVLQGFGYQVLAAENGLQALAIYEAHRSEIGLVLLDIVMPVLGGVDAAVKLRELDRDLPVLFLSGYEKGDALARHPEIEDIKVLSKPVNLAELSQHIRRYIAVD